MPIFLVSAKLLIDEKEMVSVWGLDWGSLLTPSFLKRHLLLYLQHKNLLGQPWTKWAPKAKWFLANIVLLWWRTFPIPWAQFNWPTCESKFYLGSCHCWIRARLEMTSKLVSILHFLAQHIFSNTILCYTLDTHPTDLLISK